MKSLLALLLTVASVALAAPAKEVIEIVNEDGRAVARPTPAPALRTGDPGEGGDTVPRARLRNREQRARRSFQAGGLAGVTVPPIVSGGAWFGFLLDEDSILTLELTHGKGSPKTFFNVEATTFGAHYQRFLSNTFYMKFGVDDRRTRIMDTKYRYASPDSRIETKKGDFLVGAAHIGNQWQFGGFTFGVDWFGLTTPLYRLSSSEDLDGFSADDRRTIENQWEDLSWSTNVQYLRVFIGGSW